MKKVLHVSDLFEEKKGEKALNPIEFTHFLSANLGWVETKIPPTRPEKVVYLGKCNVDGDMFALYENDDTINVFKGHLNDGIIE